MASTVVDVRVALVASFLNSLIQRRKERSVNKAKKRELIESREESPEKFG